MTPWLPCLALLFTTSLYLNADAAQDRLGLGNMVRGHQQRKEPKGTDLQKAAIPPPPPQQADVYTNSAGYIVRIMKQQSITHMPAQPTQAPAATGVSPVYPIKRPEAGPATSYAVPPPRQVVTMPAPVNPPATGKPQPTGKAPAKPVAKDDDDNEAGEDGTETKPDKTDNKKQGGNNNSNNGKSSGDKTVTSSDPWGDFVFPTRSPKPNWARNGAPSPPLASLSLLILPILAVIAHL